MSKLEASIINRLSNLKETEFVRRRLSIVDKIKGGIAIINSGMEKTETRDMSYKFRIDSDFAYLCALREPKAALVIDARTKRNNKIMLYLQERDKRTEQWLGEYVGLSRAKKIFQLDEVKDITSLPNDLPELCCNTKAMFFNPGANPDVDKAIFETFSSPISPSFKFPSALIDIKRITANMRLVKSSAEIEIIRQAVQITALGIDDVYANSIAHCDSRSTELIMGRIAGRITERKVASVLSNNFVLGGADGDAFHPIVASGAHATCLHHAPTSKVLQKGELVLIDAGANVNDYNGDISRVFPVGGRFTSVQSEVYDCVLEASRAACRTCKPGASLSKIHAQARQVLSEGLINLGILKRSCSSKKREEILTKYCVHHTSHYLGLDVHDINPYSDEAENPKEIALPIGAVFTVEPGLYFPKDDTSIPKEMRGIGVRIEENVLINKNGSEVLSPCAKTLQDLA